jgi:Mg/Co/Ni transporter MgtE
MLADQLDYIVGVDPHRDSHALAVVEVVSGAVLFEATVDANSDGYALALDEPLRDAQERVRATPFDLCFVVNDERVVLGMLGRRALAGEDDVTVEEAMTAGPSTVRPSLPLDEALARMRRQDLTLLPVTRSDGVLIGALMRSEVEGAGA